MKSAILNNGDNHLHISKAFHAIDNDQHSLADYNWLVTDIDCFSNDSVTGDLFRQKYVWLSYQDLTQYFANAPMFLWGVFSGFSKQITLEQVLTYELPLADGYSGFWVNNVRIQHPLADVEIVAWDGLYTLVISKHDDIIERFRRSFPLSEDLQAKNKRENSEVERIKQLLIQELTIHSIPISEKILFKKYDIWRELFYNRGHQVTDNDIVRCIHTKLNI